jgi:hypothetical protein
MHTGVNMNIRIAALSALACWATQVGAAAPAVGITGALTHFGYTLQSLGAASTTPPTGSLLPTLAPDAPADASAMAVDLRTYLSTTTGSELFPVVNGVASGVSASGIMRGSLSPEAIQTSLAADAAQVAQLLADRSPNGNTLLSAYAGATPFGGLAITLQAHSAITFTGTFHNTVSWNPDALDPVMAPYFDGENTAELVLVGGARMNAQLVDLTQNEAGEGIVDTSVDELFSTVQYRHLPADLRAGQPWLIDERSPSSLSFVRTFRNPYDMDLTVLLQFEVASELSVGRINLKNNGLVPEPGTWALMGLGLVGLSLAARRKRTG